MRGRTPQDADNQQGHPHGSAALRPNRSAIPVSEQSKMARAQPIAGFTMQRTRGPGKYAFPLSLTLG
ncbi:hypothetical protein PLANTIT3_70132 [Plantibacter sp. T3]|nr:hypothetical protein PLANTIT3_70132 [Plantibacter sp. T3]